MELSDRALYKAAYLSVSVSRFMARSDRLLRLLHTMRVLPQPITAARLAEETGVSVRSLYRDIESLRAAGARIDGERGYGYRLTEDVALPPQLFTRIEIEALVLGLNEVRHIGDAELAQAADSALAKITATLPEKQQQQTLHAVSQVYRFDERASANKTISLLREASWNEQAVMLRYTDAEGRTSERKVWPLAIVYLDRSLTLLTWCCLRRAFRMFRIDRITDAERTEESFRPRRVSLLRDYVAKLQGTTG